MANQSVIIGGKSIPLVVGKRDCNPTSRQPGGKYHVPPVVLNTTMVAAHDSRNVYQIYGFQDRIQYATAGEHSMGSISTQLFRDVRDPQNVKVVRLRGLFTQQSAYLMLGWEDTAIAPTPDMPKFTDKLTLSNRPAQVYTLSQANGGAIELGVQYEKLWSGTVFGFTIGQEITIEFID